MEKLVIKNIEGKYIIANVNINQGSKFYYSIVLIPKKYAVRLINKELKNNEEVELT